jgi:hypothetical protein
VDGEGEGVRASLSYGRRLSRESEGAGEREEMGERARNRERERKSERARNRERERKSERAREREREGESESEVLMRHGGGRGLRRHYHNRL